MITQGKKFEKEIISAINEIIRNHPNISRAQLSKKVCKLMDWRNPRGDLKSMSCRKALNDLDAAGHIKLPSCRKTYPFHKQRKRAQTPPEETARFRGAISDLGEIDIILLRSPKSIQYGQWRDLMDACHPLQSGPLCGAQLRYLVVSENHGIVGGLSYSSAAFRLRCRQEFIGWTEEARDINRELVVLNSRFLIAPTVQVPNLASHILAKAESRLISDWQERYGVEPVLLETFVVKEVHEASSYRACGWQEIGVTVGRGRQDRENKCAKKVKRVLIKPLQSDWRERLCRCKNGEVIVKRPQKKEPEDWAEAEFEGLDLGDKRLNIRAVTLLRQFFNKPGSPIPVACEDKAGLQGAYRFIHHQKITMDKVLDPHVESAIERASKEDVVLCVQDSTSLNYTHLKCSVGFGPIGEVQTKTQGLMLHDTIMFNESGVPQGFLDVQCWSRGDEARDKNKLKEIPIEEKESNKWMISYEKACEVQRRHPETRFISVGDRESDVYELFYRAFEREDNAGLLVRAEKSRQRCTVGGTRVWEKMLKKPVSGVIDVKVPARESQPARDARCEVRFGQVRIKPPRHLSNLPPVTIWAVYVCEKDCKPGDGLEWMLFTTEPTETIEDALVRTEQYGVRWGIEVFHRTLKSGCRMEDRQFQKAERITTCLALDMIVGWRVYYLTQLGRDIPDVPATVFFTEDEWRALVTFIEKKPVSPDAEVPSLGEAMQKVGSLGGHQKRNGNPGTETMWRGIQRLSDITATIQILTQAGNGT